MRGWYKEMDPGEYEEIRLRTIETYGSMTSVSLFISVSTKRYV